MDPAAMIVAASALITAVGGILLSRRGQEDTAKQEQAAAKIAEREQELNRTRLALDAYESLNNTQRRELERLHEWATVAQRDAFLYRAAISELVDAIRLLARQLPAETTVQEAIDEAEATVDHVLDSLPSGENPYRQGAERAETE